MVKIITDSSTLYTVEEAREKGFEAIPLCISIGDLEGRDLQVNMDEFYGRIEKGEIPRSSQPPIGEVIDAYEQYSDYEIINIAMADGLSGTYQSAMIAENDFENIYVVDGASAAIGGGILVEYALKLADQGMEAKEIAKELEKVKENVVVVALVDTLEYLRKGGRVSSAVAFAGGVLNIKPVLSLTNGEINMLGKARGSKQGNNLLVQEIEKSGGVDFSKPVLLGYTFGKIYRR